MNTQTQAQFNWDKMYIDIERLPLHFKIAIVEYHSEKVWADLSSEDINSIVRKHNLRRMQARYVIETWLVNEGIIGYAYDIIHLVESVQRSAVE